MKTLTKLVLAIAILTTAAAAKAEWVSGHFRSNGTYVSPYLRTPANGIPYDNLSYRGYPSQEPGYISPRKSGLDSSFTLPNYDFNRPSINFGHGSRRPSTECLDSGMQTLPNMFPSLKSRQSGF